MQDISRVVGNPVIVHSKTKNRDFSLRGLTFESLGGLQSQILRDMRKKKLETAAELAAMLPPEDRLAILEKARQEAEQIAYLSNEELKDFVTTDIGAVYLIWFLFEQDYPGAMTRGDVLAMLASGELGRETLEALITTAFGGDPAGNSTGQGASAGSGPAKTAGGSRSGYSNSRRKKGGSESRRRRPSI